MNALCIETSTRDGSAARINGSHCRSASLAVSDSGSVASALRAFLNAIGDSTPPDVVLVGIGPGSYTAMRIGVALAQGLATAWGRPCQGVPSWRAVPSTCPAKWLVGDAGRGMCFRVDRSKSPKLPSGGIEVLDGESLDQWLGELPPGEAAILGPIPRRWEANGIRNTLACAHPLAELLAEQAGSGVSFGEPVEPIYLQEAVASSPALAHSGGK